MHLQTFYSTQFQLNRNLISRQLVQSFEFVVVVPKISQLHTDRMDSTSRHECSPAQALHVNWLLRSVETGWQFRTAESVDLLQL
jgi:hypothetical protein